MNTPATATNAGSAKRSAALFSVVAALVITILKLVTGLLTGSLGLLSDAAHSSIDLVAAAITLFSVGVADRPADDDHNYGHGKVESLSALVESLLMLGSCLWIVSEAVHRLFTREHLALALSPWPFVVLLLSIATDFSRARKLHQTAVQFGSVALEADALHFRTDIWSSTAVLLGLVATWVGERFHIAGLEIADPLAALVVSVVILRVTWVLARQTVDTLLDATPTQNPDGSPANIRRDLIRELATLDGVLSVDRLRVRQSGSRFFADLTLGMPRSLTFARSEQLNQAATAAVQRHLPGADVVIHSVPRAFAAESVHDRVRAVAARSNLAIHDLTLHQHAEGLHLEQHLEVDEAMSLRQAHDLVTELETSIRREVPEIHSLLTHIESEPATITQPDSLDPDRDLEGRLRRLAASIPGIVDIHDVLVTRIASSPIGAPLLQVSCHCTLPDDLPMSVVHERITELESAFKRESPKVTRFLIHPEPTTDNRR